MIDDKQSSSLNKQDISQLYVKAYKKLNEKEKFIEDTITKFTKMMESGLYMANPNVVGGKTVQGGVPIAKEFKIVVTMTEANELVRYFPKKNFHQNAKIVLLAEV